MLPTVFAVLIFSGWLAARAAEPAEEERPAGAVQEATGEGKAADTASNGDTATIRPPELVDPASLPRTAEPDETQGIVVVTDDPDCQVVINGVVRGKGERVFVALEPGTHNVAARKDECFDDTERESVSPGQVTTVSAHARAVHPTVVPPSYCTMVSKDRVCRGVQAGAGVWYQRHLFESFFAVGSGRGWSTPTGTDSLTVRDYGTFQLNIAGINYLYCAVAREHVQLGIGATAAWGALIEDVEYSVQTDSVYYYDQQAGWSHGVVEKSTSKYAHNEKDFVLLGPRVALQAGLEHVKLLVAGSYLIRSDTQGMVSDPRNFYLLQAGLSFVF
jgi:hypothetical protein